MRFADGCPEMKYLAANVAQRSAGTCRSPARKSTADRGSATYLPSARS